MMNIEQLLHKKSIEELVVKYCRAVDRKDYLSLATLYHLNSHDDHGEMFQGSGGDFIKWLPEVLEAMEVTTHLVSNHLITVDGEKAEGEVFCQAYHLTKDGQEILIGGRYLDKYIFDDGRWWFKARKIVLDWNQVSGQPRCDFESSFTQGVDRGASVDQDPSGSFFSFFNTQG